MLLVYVFEPYSRHRIASLRASGTVHFRDPCKWVAAAPQPCYAQPARAPLLIRPAAGQPEHHDSPDLLLAARQMLTKAVESIAEAHARLAAQLGLLSASTVTGARTNMADVRPQQKTTVKSLTCGNYH